MYIYGSCFCIYSASLFLLVATFNLFTFKVIIYIYISLSIFPFSSLFGVDL